MSKLLKVGIIIVMAAKHIRLAVGDSLKVLVVGGISSKDIRLGVTHLFMAGVEMIVAAQHVGLCIANRLVVVVIKGLAAEHIWLAMPNRLELTVHEVVTSHRIRLDMEILRKHVVQEIRHAGHPFSAFVHILQSFACNCLVLFAQMPGLEQKRRLCAAAQ